MQKRTRNKNAAISCLLAAALLLGGAFPAAAASSGAGAERIVFPEVSAEDIAMHELAVPGENKLTLAENGRTAFSLVVPDDCPKTLREAAAVFCTVFEELTGAALPLCSETDARFLACTIRLDTALGTARPEPENLADGYRTVVGDDYVSICGATPAGTRNGVYGFLEDKLGCMFLTPDDTFVPQQPTIRLEKTEEMTVPATQWRDVYAYETIQNKWAAKLRLNGVDVEADDASVGIELLQYEGWGTWCHNCYEFLSPEDYFDTHPEYFSEVDGERVTEYMGRDAYLCLSNPEVFEIVKNALAEKIAAEPDKLYWDFSGSDNPALPGCMCAACTAADEAAGGTGMGTLLPFLNKLAEAFPDKYISTLAYLHTLKAPTGIKAAPNVVIKLCSMPGDQASSYLAGANPEAREFQQQILEWSSITDKIVVWDYVVDFENLLLPFPNFAVQANNQKFYEDNHIIGVFHQASREAGGEFAALRAYVLSKLMWEGSGLDVASCVSRYVRAYFGDAAPAVTEYMNLCAAALADADVPLGLYDGMAEHHDGYLSAENIAQYLRCIEEAKAAAAGDSVLSDRVEEVEISVLYAQLLGPETEKAVREAALARFNALCEKHGVTMVGELESLEDFNAGGLQAVLKADRGVIYKPYYIGFGVAGGVLAVAAVAAAVVAVVRKKRRRAAG